jgi:hypothetical protein
MLAVYGCGGSHAHDKRSSGSLSPIKYLGSTYTLASGRVPEGAAFSILARRYRFWGRYYVELSVRYATPGQVEEGGSTWGGGEVLEWGTHTGCQGHRFAIINGILKAPEDSVSLRAAGELTLLRKTALPAALHYRGALVYGVAPSSRYALLVRTPAGKSVEEPSLFTAVTPDACHRTEHVEHVFASPTRSGSSPTRSG